MTYTLPDPSRFWAVDFLPHHTGPSDKGESGKIKRVTREATSTDGGREEGKCEYYFRKHGLDGGGFSHVFAGVRRVPHGDGKLHVENLEAVIIKELRLKPEGADASITPDTHLSRKPSTASGPEKSKPHKVVLLDALREPALMQYFNVPQKPLDVMMNDDQSKLLIVMPMMSGNLSHVQELLHTMAPQTRFMFLMYHLLKPLAVFHDNQRVHRDIKPANILLDKPNGALVLGDLGALTDLPEVSPGSGSPRYQATEQRDRRGPSMGQPSDVFQVAVVVAESLISAKSFFNPPSRRDDDNKTPYRLHSYDGCDQEAFAAWWADPARFAKEDPDGAAHFEQCISELAEQLSGDQFDMLTRMLHPNPQGRPNVRTCLRDLAAWPVDAEANEEVQHMWDLTPDYPPRAHTHLQQVIAEVKTIFDHRDHPHVALYVNELDPPRDPTTGIKPPVNVDAMLDHLHTQGPYEREKGPRLRQKKGLDLRQEVMHRRRLQALAWRVWYAEGADREAPELLRVALENFNYNGAKLLLGSGLVKPHAFDGALPFTTALDKGAVDVARMLLVQGFGLDNRDMSKGLGVAVYKRNISLVSLLLERGTDPNLCNKYGHDVMYGACKSGDVELTKAIIAHGARLFNAQADQRWVPVDYQKHSLMDATLRSYALLLPALFGQGNAGEKMVAIGETMLAAQSELGNVYLLALLQDFLVAIDGRPRMVAWCQDVARRQGYDLPGRLSEDQRLSYRQQVPVGLDAAGQPRVPMSAPPEALMPRVYASQVAARPPTPTLLVQLTDDERVRFGAGRAALFAGKFEKARQALEPLLQKCDAVRLHHAYALIGLGDLAGAKAACNALVGSQSESVAFEAINTRSLIFAMQGAWQSVVEDCDYLVARQRQRGSDAAPMLKRRSLAHTHLGNETEALADFAQVQGVQVYNGVKMHNGVPAYMARGGKRVVYLTLI